jgi:serine/threonine-protein kinase
VLEQSRLPADVAVDIAAQVAEGLAFAHEHDIVHRDIKPGNIMVLAGNQAKIMDFGLARVRHSDVKTQAGMMVGSPRYMSPEQVAGRVVDHRTDIHSLGAVLYEMLTGQHAFPGDGIPQILFDVVNAPAPVPSHVNPELDGALDLIVGKAMAKNAEARYASAAELARDLRGYLEGARAPAARAAALVPHPEATSPAVEAFSFSASRRFDSTRAIDRLARSRGADRNPPVGASSSLKAPSGTDRVILSRVVTVVVASAIAMILVFA